MRLIAMRLAIQNDRDHGLPGRVRLSLRLAGCLVIAACVHTSGATFAAGNAKQEITRLSDLRKLTEREARSHIPIHVQATVTYYDAVAPDMFVQDASGAAWVNVDASKPHPQPGDLIDLRGVSNQPDFAPQIEQPAWSVVAQSRMPKPDHPSLGALFSTVEDGRWVEVDGIVRQFAHMQRTAQENALLMSLEVSGSRIDVTIPWTGQDLPLSWLDSRVRLQGACGAEFNGRNQLYRVVVYVPNFGYIRSLDAADPDPFAKPVRKVGELQKFGMGQLASQRLRLDGTVTAAFPGKGIYIEDDSGSIQVPLQDNLPASGSKIQVIGFVRENEAHLVVADAMIHTVQTGGSPLPKPVTVAEAMSGEHDSALVEMQGEVVGQSEQPHARAIVVREHNILFTVLVPGDGRQALALAPGSMIRIAGICVAEVDASGKVTDIHVLASSPQDISTISPAPWWTVSKALTFLAVLLVSVAFTLGWIVFLRRRVIHQTEMIRASMESTADGILVVDNRGRVVLWNKKFVEMWGLDPAEGSIVTDEELIQHAMRQLKDPEGFRARILELHAKQDEQSDDLVELLDGRVFERHSEPQRVKGRNIGRVWGFRDSTARIRSEQALRVRTDQQHGIAELGRFALTQTEVEPILERARQLVLTGLAMDRCDILVSDGTGNELKSCLPGGSARFKLANSDEEEALRAGRPLVVQGEAIRDSGRHNSLGLEGLGSGAIVPIVTGDLCHRVLTVASGGAGSLEDEDVNFLASVAHVLASAVDRKQTDLKMIAAKDAAEAANKAKSEFLAVMSHEIRTPMNGVVGMTSLLLDSHLTDLQRDSILTIKHSGQMLLQVISDILDFSKIEAGKLDLETTPFSLREMVDEVLAIGGELARQRGLALKRTVGAELPDRFLGDPVRLRQILLNLISNAAKFTHAGCVSLTIKALSKNGASSRLHFEVTDTGIGIEEGVLSKLFNTFSQADSSTTRKYGGTGLGLVISRRLVELMKGQIGVQSKFGHGSTFWFELELAHAQTESGALPASNSIASLTSAQQTTEPRESLHILVVEDNLVNQKVALQMLKKWNHQVQVASDGQHAVEMADLAHYDLILMDCQMPRMDGFEATRQIRAGGSLNVDTAIVAVTANAFPEDRTRCLEAGMNDYISKPITRPALESVILRWGAKTAAPVLNA